VNTVLHLPWHTHQGRETPKSLLIQVGLLGDFDLGGIRQQHPHRNLQTPSRRIDDGDRAISPLWSAHDLNGRTVKWVKTVEHLDVRSFCAQGTVGVGGFVPMFTPPFPRDSRQITVARSALVISSSYA
jgi:hypothetical protein